MMEQLCKLCGHVVIAEELPKKCPKCGSGSCTIRLYSPDKERSDFINICLPDNERFSRTLGCLPNQLEDAKKRHPGAEFIRNGKSYVMRIKNRAEKLQRANERWGKGNWEEFD